MDNDPAELMNLATWLAKSAGKIVRDAATSQRSSIATKTSTTDNVTATDQASEEFIASQLKSSRPDDGILGEEGAAVASKNGIEWVIDPIDGTTNFIYGLPNFAVSVGATVDGIPVAGAVYNPSTDELFCAYTGGGAFLNDTSISVNRADDFSLALIATGFAYNPEVRAQQGRIVAELLPQVRDIRRLGSAALDICNVACGRVDAYYEQGVRPWDVTAASVVLREAGGIVTGFTDDMPWNDVVAACTTGIHSRLRALAAPA